MANNPLPDGIVWDDEVAPVQGGAEAPPEDVTWDAPLSKPVSNLTQLIQKHASAYGIPIDTAMKLVQQESRGDPKATSRAGAKGLMQLMPGTARDVGVFNPYDPDQNVGGGMKYLRQLLDKYDGNMQSALAAYNMGPGAFDLFLKGKRGMPTETINYVKSITGTGFRGAYANEPADMTGMQGAGDVSQIPSGQHMKSISATLPLVGAMVGGTLAAPLNVVAPGVAEVAGATGGYLIGKQAQNRLDELTGNKEPTDLAGAAQEVVSEVPDAATMALAGPVGGKIIEGAAGLVGKVIRPVIGSLTGKGTGAVEEAIASGTKTGITRNPIKSATDFDRAMRDEITGEEVVQNARDALKTVKDQRGDAYTSILGKIQGRIGPIDTMPIKVELTNLVRRYNVKITPSGDLDFSRVAMGKAGRDDIREIVEKVRNWGSVPEDNTAIGLDVLKRQLDDFYSESSQARAFVTALRNKVKDTIVAQVPQYAEMTKGYAEATKLIKDLEAGLMLRKQGMTGRVTADMTLRRLTSAMRDNFPLRRELVNAMSNQSGVDLGGQIAGYAMSDVLPSGLMRIGAATISAAEMLRLVEPKYLAIIVSASPRVQGEFLRLFGKGLSELKGTAPLAARAITAAQQNQEGPTK